MSNALAIENPRAVVGGNNPPEPTPFETVSVSINDLYGEAKLWLDGEPVSTQEQASALNTLQTRIREAAKLAEKCRKDEAKPFDDGKKEVQERYKPVIAKADQADDAVKAALKPYLLALQAEQDRIAKAAREEAARKQQEAVAAMRERDASNLQQREDAEKLVRDAKEAEEAARRAENAKAHAKGEGRATGLRTVYRPVLTDRRAAAAWVWSNHTDDLMTFIQNLAEKAVRAGARSVPGFDVIEEKVL